MGRTIASASMSLDGFVSYDDHTVGRLFDWYHAGDVRVANAGDLPDFRLTRASARYWTAYRENLGALVVGRRLFDVTDGWSGTHPLGVPVVLLTHEGPTDWPHPTERTHVVTTGIRDAVALARDLAGDGDVGVAAGTMATQALAAGLLDLVNVDLVPVVMGSGHRYFTADVDPTTSLGDPVSVVAGARVTHLTFPVRP